MSKKNKKGNGFRSNFARDFAADECQECGTVLQGTEFGICSKCEESASEFNTQKFKKTMNELAEEYDSTIPNKTDGPSAQSKSPNRDGNAGRSEDLLAEEKYSGEEYPGQLGL